MKIKQLNDAETEALGKAYERLVDWIQDNDVDGECTLGMLLKAAMVIAISNDISKDEIMEAVHATYAMERFFHPTSDEVH